jgi:hypothetical protein
MRPAFIVAIVVALVVIAAAIAWQRRDSPAARQERAVDRFLTVLPEQLNSEKRLEVHQLLYTFYTRAKDGKVAAEDVETITGKLEDYTRAGNITMKDLDHLMAEVGYTSYKGDERFNLPDKSVDHPVLNPEAGMVSLRFDSTQYDSAFWADFAKWKKDHAGEFSDSAMLPTPGR